MRSCDAAPPPSPWAAVVLRRAFRGCGRCVVPPKYRCGPWRARPRETEDREGRRRPLQWQPRTPWAVCGLWCLQAVGGPGTPRARPSGTRPQCAAADPTRGWRGGRTLAARHGCPARAGARCLARLGPRLTPSEAPCPGVPRPGMGCRGRVSEPFGTLYWQTWVWEWARIPGSMIGYIRPHRNLP